MRKRQKRQYGRVLVNGFDLGPAQRDPETGVVEAGTLAELKDPKHCDDYIEDESQPACLRKYLDWARLPAHGHMVPRPWPELYADWDSKRVRVTMASRLGTIGWTTDLTQDIGYQHRGWVEHLTNFGDTP